MIKIFHLCYCLLLLNEILFSAEASPVEGGSVSEDMEEPNVLERADEPVCAPRGKLCLTKECIRISADMLGKIDMDKDPCDDFFEFVCGQWKEKNAHEINGDNIYYASNLSEMPTTVDELLEDLITEKRKIGDEFYKTKSFADLKIFYQSCMDTDLLNKYGFEPAYDLLKDLKEFQTQKTFQETSWNLTRSIVELSKMNGWPLVHVSMETDLQNSKKWMPILTMPRHFGLIPNELISDQPFKRKVQSLKEMLLHSKEMSGIMKRVTSDRGLGQFLRESLSQMDSLEGRNSVLKLLQERHKTSEKNLGRPTKLTSFFSRIVETDSVNRVNGVEFSSFEEGEEGEKEGSVPPKPETWSEVFEWDLIDKSTTEKFDDADSKVEELPEKDFDKNVVVPRPNSVPEDDLPTPSSVDNVFGDMGNVTLTPDEESPFANILNILSEMNELFEKHDFTTSSDYGYSNFTDIDFDLLKLVLKELSREDLFEGVTEGYENRTLENIWTLATNLHIKGIICRSSHNDSRIAVTEVMELIKMLRKIEPNDREKILAMHNGQIFTTFTINELQAKYPIIDWLYLLNSVLKGPIRGEAEVLVPFPDFIEDVFAVLDGQNPHVLHDALLVIFTYDVLKELVQESNDTTRDEFCLAVTKEIMNYPLSHLYLKYLGDDTLTTLRDEIEPVTQSLIATAKQQIKDNLFLTTEDKENALKKVMAMKWQIGGLDDLYNLSYVESKHEKYRVFPRHFLLNVIDIYKIATEQLYETYSKPFDDIKQIWSYTSQPYTINAFYVQSTNSIVIPEAFFKAPYFYAGAPSYFTFGSSGTAFAHEMMHGFDSTGMKFDHNGAYTSPFSDQMTNELKKGVDCYNEMVTALFSKVEEVDGFDVLMTVDNNATINENFADVVGLDFAYKAYIAYAKSLKEEEPLLPGLPFTREQLFFIAYAQPYCALLPGVAKLILMEVDEHLVHDIRINAALVNYPGFTKAFQCLPDQNMTSGNLMPACQIF